MIEKYIYAVTKELPKNSRKKIAAELLKLITERISELDDNLSEEQKIEYVLIELGNPKLLAAKYRGKERYLIGPMYFDQYLSILKIVSLAIFIGISIAFSVATIFSIENLIKLIGGYISSLLSALAQGVVWVTGIFALVEYNEIYDKSDLKQKYWNLSYLPEVPEKKARISKGESIFSIIFTTLILPFFFFSPEVVGFYYNIENQVDFFPLFNMTELTLFRIVIFIVFILNLLIELIKIIKGRWTLNLAIIITLLNIISSALLILAISDENIWNVESVHLFEQYTRFRFDQIISLIVAVVMITTIAESISILYKGYRYGNELSDM